MQRSNTISNFLDNKSKKLWSNPFSKPESSRASSISSGSPSSTITSSLSRSRSRSSMTVGTPSPHVSTPQNLKRRSSLMISDTASKVSPGTSAQKHKSFLGFGSLKVDVASVSDPKELEFYNQLFNTTDQTLTASTILEADEDDSISEDMANSSSFSASHVSDQMSETSSPTTTASSADLKKTTETHHEAGAETLSSALADYQLFTNLNSIMVTPTTPVFPTESERTILHSVSIPSLLSIDTLESEPSVMKVSNSLWVGITTEEPFEMKRDVFEEFHANSLFDENEPRGAGINHSQRRRRTSHRTSLVFA